MAYLHLHINFLPPLLNSPSLLDTDLKISSENAWSLKTVIKNLHFYPNLSCPRWFADTHAAVANGRLSPCFLLQGTTPKA